MDRGKRVRELWQFIRAQISTGIASGLEWVVIAAILLLHWHYEIAVVAGALVGAVTDFVVKRHWVFGERKGSVEGQAVRYAVISGASLVLNMGGAAFFVEVLHLPPAVGVVAAALAIGFLWNYPMHRFFVFRRNPRQDHH